MKVGSIMLKYRKLYDRLMQEKIQIVEKLDQLKTLRQPQADGRENSSFGKREEEANETFELEKSLVLENKLGENLSEVEHALEKHLNGTYGICDNCGKIIDKARLEAMPKASLCIECKSNPSKYAKTVK